MMMTCLLTTGSSKRTNVGCDGSTVPSGMAAANATARGQRHAILRSPLAELTGFVLIVDCRGGQCGGERSYALTAAWARRWARLGDTCAARGLWWARALRAWGWQRAGTEQRVAQPGPEARGNHGWPGGLLRRAVYMEPNRFAASHHWPVYSIDHLLLQ